MRRAASAMVALVLIAGGAGTAAAHLKPVLLRGSFAMRGTITQVVDVYGEHVGQHVRRIWTFVPQCSTAGCRRVLLRRQRSGQHILDSIMLTRQAYGSYAGHGTFWIALRCGGQVVPHGGLASERITVRVTGTATVGTTLVATAIRATYTNPSRQNLTGCPGGIGHDAARYHGRLVSPLAASAGSAPS